MAQKEPKERFLDFETRGKFGKPWELGQKILGKSWLGEEEIEWDKNELGFGICGMTPLGSDDKRWGIYQLRHRLGKRIFVKEAFYTPLNPQSGPQQAWRQIFADGMAAWKALTTEQQKEYNDKANELGIFGFNLFMREYLNSH